MVSKLSAKWRCAAVVFASFLAVAVSSATQAAEKESAILDWRDSTLELSGSTPYKLDTPSPYKGIKIGDSKIIDVSPQSDRNIYIAPLHFGETNIMFFDDESPSSPCNKNDPTSPGSHCVLIKDLQVMIRHPVETNGVAYLCWPRGCQRTAR
jgi:Flp pilus assembly secretin CpaC